NLAGGAVAVVGQRLDDDRGPAWPVTLIANFLIGFFGSGTGAAPDRAIHRIFRHVRLPGGQYGRPESWICGPIGQARAGRSRQFPDDLREDLGALFVLRALPVHDVFELRMTSHLSRRRSPSEPAQGGNVRQPWANNPIWQYWGVSGTP